MTFDATETGQLGRPVEMYEFVQSGVFTRYTSAATNQFIGVTEYEVLPGLSHTEPVQGNEITSGEVKITMPSSEPIPQQFRGTIPSSLPTVTIFKRHLNDAADEVVVWVKGTVISCSFEEDFATLVVQPPTRIFSRPMPRAVYSGVCNNQLYDTACGVLRPDYRAASIVIGSISVNALTITITALRAAAAAIDATLSLGLTAQELDDFWLRGYIESNVSPAEFRMVAESDVGGDPNTVRIIIPFRALGVGDTVNVFAGCPHSIDFCERKFKNFVTPGVPSTGLRFGGFPQVPSDNPFQIELDSGRNDSNIAGVRPSAFRTGGFF
jgi:hypothetical protein